MNRCDSANSWDDNVTTEELVDERDHLPPLAREHLRVHLLLVPRVLLTSPPGHEELRDAEIQNS